MFVTKSRKYRVHLEDPAGTEYLEDVALGAAWESLGISEITWAIR